METNYDEETTLTEYIWHNYSELITPFEKIVSEASKKYESGNISNGNSLAVISACLAKSNESSDQEMAKHYKQGYEYFRKKVRQRVMAMYSNSIEIKRCPKCNHIIVPSSLTKCKYCLNNFT